VNREVCSNKELTEPALLEMSGYATNQELAAIEEFRTSYWDRSARAIIRFQNEYQASKRLPRTTYD
jgi:hypothetical protein